MNDNDKRQEKIEKLKKRLKRFNMISVDNIQRVAKEYLKVKDKEIRGLMEDFLFLKPFKDLQYLAKIGYEWNTNFVNPVLQVWGENIPEKLVHRLVGKMKPVQIHSLIDCDVFKKIILQDEKLQEKILRKIERTKDVNLASYYISNVLGGQEVRAGSGQAVQMDRCLQVYLRNTTQGIDAANIVLSLWDSFSRDKRREFAEMLLENDADGDGIIYFLRYVPFGDVSSITIEAFKKLFYENKSIFCTKTAFDLVMIANRLPEEVQRIYVSTVIEFSPEDIVPEFFQYSSPNVLKSCSDILMKRIDYMEKASNWMVISKTLRYPEKTEILAEQLFTSEGKRVISIFGNNTDHWRSLIGAAIEKSETKGSSAIGLFMSNILSTVNRRKSIVLYDKSSEIRLMELIKKYLSERGDNERSNWESLALAKDFLNKTCRNILTSTNDAVRHSAELVVDLIVSMENELMLSGPADPEDENLFPGGQITEEFYSSGVVF